MVFNDLITKDKNLRAEEFRKNALISELVVQEYLSNKTEDDIIYPKSDNGVSDLLTAYFLCNGTENQLLLKDIMQEYHCNYSASIRNAITILFGRESELRGKKTDPLHSPGMISISEDDDIYKLQTVLGDITVTKASPLFRNTSSNYIFYNHLVSECFLRSYDFVKENRDSCQVVLSYMPNLFFSGHYHAYLELDEQVLDIASNCFYFSKEDSSKILNGRIIKKLSYDEIEEEYQFLERKYSDLHNSKYNKLYVLSLYHDYKNRF